MNQQAKDYMLGTSSEELDRLAYQHQVWAETTIDLWQRADFGPGQHILDLGCGPGFASLDLSRLTGPQGRVTGFDASQSFLRFLDSNAAAAGIENLDTRLGDVHQIQMDENSIDRIFVRWLLCFVERPQQVITEIQRLLRPGGRLAILDYFNYAAIRVCPHRDSIAALFKAYEASAVRNGGSYDIGAKLPAMISSAGLQLDELVPVCRVGRSGSRLWHWVNLFNQSYIPKLLADKALDNQWKNRFDRDWAELSADPAAFFFSPPMLGSVASKPV